ncbi:MAG: ABC transporter substrate-binding protein [Spirochaetaceae bacterium]|nr:MAG: ABC transporter substrate-binding protein [Spirochaetaceae bacterium]
MKRFLILVLALLSITAFAFARGQTEADPDVIKVGVLAVGEGAFAIQGVDCFRGFDMAINEFGGEVAGKRIETQRYYSDGTPDTAMTAARRAIEQDNVDILVGPLSGSEGLAIAEYAKDWPDRTFINGSSGAADTTLVIRAPNFFRFSLDGTQWQGGLGTYAYEDLGYRRVAIVAEDYSFQYTQRMGFLLEFGELGGRVVENSWVPIDVEDFSSVIASLPGDDEIDAIWIGLGGSNAVVFLEQYVRAGRTTPLIGSSVTVDATVLDVEGRFRDFLIGTPSAGPVAADIDTPEWRQFLNNYRSQFPDGFASPSLFGHAYYVGTKAMLLALEEVGGDLSDGQARFQQALANIDFVQPTGRVRLDHNRQAIGTNIVTVVREDADGNLVNSAVKIATDVNQTMGVPEDEFIAKGSPSRTNPSYPAD